MVDQSNEDRQAHGKLHLLKGESALQETWEPVQNVKYHL